jgi:hypothetical protein
MDSDDNYTFWINNPSVLYRNNNFLKFIPVSNTTRIEQLNAVTRFFVYLLILLVITDRSKLYIQISIMSIVFIIILYYIFESDKKGKYDELYRNKETEDFCGLDDKNKIELESGYYDYENNLIIGKYQGSKKCKNKVNYSLDEINEYKRNTCRKPTEDNPFMNSPIGDFENYDPPEACNVDDDEIKDKMVNMFNKDLFRDVGDLFERQNSQRMYYTIPYTTVPDQTGFANWLYGNHKTCRNDQKECLRYEDLRYTTIR